MAHITITSKTYVMAVLWPSFVTAGIFSGLLFAFIDPLTFTHELGLDAESRLTGYSITFLFLWALAMVAILAAIAVLRTPQVSKVSENQ